MSLVRHTASGLFAYGLPLAAGIVSIPLYLHVLGPEGYGVFILLLVLLNYAAFLDLGAGKAAAFQLARAGSTSSDKRATITAAGAVLVPLICLPLVAGLLMVLNLLVPLLPQSSGSAPDEIKSAVALAVLTLPFMAFMSFLSGVYQGELRFFRLNGIQAAGGVALQILPLAACWLIQARLDIAMAAVFAVRFGMVIALLVCLGKTAIILRAFFRPDMETLRELVRFGRWPAITNLLASVITSGDRFVISNLAGAGAVAAYSVPFDLANRLMIIAGSVANTIFPSLAGNEDDAARKTRSAGAALISLLTPITIIMVLLLAPFLELWIGSELAERGHLIGEVILIGVWATAIGALAQSRLLAANRGKFVVASYFCQLPLFFAAVYFGMAYFGLTGVAAAWSFRCYLDAVVMQILSRDGLGLWRDIWPHATVLLLALAVAVCDQGILSRLVALAVLCGIALALSRSTFTLVFRRLWLG